MTATRMLGILLLLTLLLAGACSGGGSRSVSPDLPQQYDNYIDGYLMDSDGKPIPDQGLFITDLDYEILDEIRTKEDGYFRFDLNPTSEYYIFTRSASNSPDGGWKYSSYGGNYSNPGSPSDKGVVNPETGIKIYIPDGSTVALPPPDEYEVDFGAGEPVMFALRGTNTMTKILEDTDLNSLESYTTLEGARGEHEAFQVTPKLFQAIDSIHDVEVQVSDLVFGNNRILKDKISVYKVDYVEVTVPSDSGGAIDLWPDALVPLTHTFDVSRSFPSPVWIDIEIPRDAAPGIYNGQVKFETSDAGSATYNYSLEVWNITFPKKFYMKATIGLNCEDIGYHHNLDFGLNSPAGRIMARNYASFLADRHIATTGSNVMHPSVYLNPDNKSYYIDFDQMEDDIVTYLDTYDLPTFHFPLDPYDLIGDGFIAQNEPLFSDDFNERFLNYVEQVSTYLSTRGYLDRGTVIFVDEPNSAEDYEMVRQISNLLNQASIRPSHMVTEQPAPEDPAWGTLTDYVDIFTSSVRPFYFMGGEDIARVGGENKEEWVYTGTNVYPFPSFSIDKDGIEPRIFLWFAYQHDFQGILYYSATNWQQLDVFENPLTLGPEYGNGNGYLVYPGPLAYENTGQADVDGPITSIRLENIREGLEDTQLLYLLGNGEPVDPADPILSTWFGFTRDPDELLLARRQIADQIMDN